MTDSGAAARAVGDADGIGEGDGVGTIVGLDAAGVGTIVGLDAAGLGPGEGEAGVIGVGVVATTVFDPSGATVSSAFAVETPVIARPIAITIVVIEARILFMTCSWVREIYVGLWQGAPHGCLFALRGAGTAVMQTSGASVRLGNRLGSGREIREMQRNVDFGFTKLR